MFLFASFWLVGKIRIILILNHNSELVQTIGGICIQITFLNSAKIFGSSRIRIQANPSTEFSYLFWLLFNKVCGKKICSVWIYWKNCAPILRAFCSLHII